MKITILNEAGEVTNVIESPHLDHARRFFPHAREWQEGDEMPQPASMEIQPVPLEVPKDLLVDNPDTPENEADPSFWQKALSWANKIMGRA
jgi:hypothetical protein